MNAMMKKIITEKVEWLREHGVLCYVGNLDDATPAEIDKLCDAIEDMTTQVLEAEGEGKPWEADDDCDYDDDDDIDEALSSYIIETVHDAVSAAIKTMATSLSDMFGEKQTTEIIKKILPNIADEM